MDDWGQEVDDDAVAHQTGRTVTGRAAPDPELVRELAARLRAAERPVLVAGPDIDASGGWDAAVALAEGLGLAVWATPAPGGGRLGFPETHGLFQGVLPPAIGPLCETLAGHDLVVVVGSSVFPYYPNIPGALLSEGTALVAITSDPDEAARAPMGDALLADPALALEALIAELGVGEGQTPAPRAAPEPAELSDPLSASAAMDVLAGVFPADGIVVLESPSSTMALRNRLRLSRPGSYFFSAGGGLGFGLPASIGVQLARPERPVVCVLGEGSAQYAVQGFWTAAAYRVPVTFLVLRNEEYSILKWFGSLENIEGAPGLDLPALDTAALAAGYGVETTRADEPELLRDALTRAIASDGPSLVETRVAPGMSVLLGGLPVADPVARAGPVARGAVVRVGQAAAVERQAAAADALGQPRPEALELGDPVVDAVGPRARQALPVAARGGAVGRELGELLADLVERQPDPLGEDDEGDPPQHAPRIAAVARPGALGLDQPALVVVAQGGGRHAAALGHVADGQEITQAHLSLELLAVSGKPHAPRFGHPNVRSLA